MLKHASIISKFIGVVAVMGAVAAVIAIFGWTGLSTLKRSMLTIEQTGEIAQESMDLRIDIIAISRMTYQLARQPEKYDEFAAETERRIKEMTGRLPVLEAKADDAEKRLLSAVGARLDAYFADLRKMVAAARANAGDRAAIDKLLMASLETQKAVTDAVKAYTTYSGQEIRRTRDNAFGSVDRFQLLQIAVATLGILGGLLLSVMIARHGVMMPLRKLNETMRRIAGGDLDSAVEGADRRDEIGQMASALQSFQKDLVRIRQLEAEERAASAARIRSADAMASVVSDVGEVVAAAAAGDFSARLQVAHGDEQIQRLVAGINEINAVVDSATTEFAQVLQALAAGDLTHKVPTAYRGRFAELKQAINDTVDKLSATLRTIQTTASDVGLSAREISTGADDLSKRTEEQASSLEESAATTEELAASVKAAAQAAQQAVRQAGQAMQVAQDGGAIVTNAVSAMARIEEASKKISDIIRVIDDIAFQTNLLALNAAVEAARAGDAGKGFAVVASEVRTLAQRSGEAAKDISGLISSSNAEVEQGVKLVRQAGDALTRIVEAAGSVQSTVSEVAAASSEQANGIEEMSQTVAHMDEMTQANAALAEQSAASANALSGKIGELNALVAAFRTGDNALAAAPAPAAPYAPPRLRAADHAAIAAGQGSEPERLRKLAEAAFQQHKAAPRSGPARKVANARAGDAGWEEF